jgi:hypothetical protein
MEIDKTINGVRVRLSANKPIRQDELPLFLRNMIVVAAGFFKMPDDLEAFRAYMVVLCEMERHFDIPE